MKIALLTLAVVTTATLIDFLPGASTTDGVLKRNVVMAQAINVELKEQDTIVKIPIGFDKLMMNAGAEQHELEGMRWIMQQESGLCHLKWENERTCPTEYPGDKYSPTDSTKGYGLCQATPAIKYAEMGADWRTNEATQLKWCIKYAKSYGSISKAVEFKKCMGSCYSTRTNSTVGKVTPWF